MAERVFRELFHRARELESLSRGGRFNEAVEDIRRQLDWLLFDGFMSLHHGNG